MKLKNKVYAKQAALIPEAVPKIGRPPSSRVLLTIFVEPETALEFGAIAISTKRTHRELLEKMISWYMGRDSTRD
jgi:hypothetical protein